MKEFVLPSCPVLTMSMEFIVGPGQLSGIAFIVNAGEVGLGCFCDPGDQLPWSL